MLAAAPMVTVPVDVLKAAVLVEKSKLDAAVPAFTVPVSVMPAESRVVVPALMRTVEIADWEEPMATWEAPKAVVAVAMLTVAIPDVTVSTMLTVSLLPAEACPKLREQPDTLPNRSGQVMVAGSAAMVTKLPVGVSVMPGPATGGLMTSPDTDKDPSILQLKP